MPPLTVDPPIQTEYRRQLNPFLSRSFLSKYEPVIRQIARDLLDDLSADPPQHLDGQLGQGVLEVREVASSKAGECSFTRKPRAAWPAPAPAPGAVVAAAAVLAK